MKKFKEPYKLKHGTVRFSEEIGGEQNMNDQITEWPTDQYLDDLTKEEFDNLKVTIIDWILGTKFGPEHDFAHALRFQNNLDFDRNTSPPYTEKMEPNDSIDLSNVRVARITAKTNFHHVAQFRFYDDFDNLIGKTIYSKYDENNDQEFEVKIPYDEKLIGFHIRQSDWEDCKTAKIAFKMAKIQPDEKLIKKVNDYFEKQKKIQAEMDARLPRNTAFCLE